MPRISAYTHRAKTSRPPFLSYNLHNILRYISISATTTAVLFTSSTSCAEPLEKSFEEMANKFIQVPADQPTSEALVKATEAINKLKQMKLSEASKLINEALQLNPRNSYLHFFNGFIYHLQARQGDSQKNDMAIEGYQQALRLDPSNWIAQEFLGLAYLDIKEFDRAKEQFSDVLLMTPDSTISIYGLMVSAYMTADPVTACAMADQYSKSSQEIHPAFVRSSILVYASCGKFEQADQMRQTLGHLQNQPMDIERIDQRLKQWKSFYSTHHSSGDTRLPSELIHASLNTTTANTSPEIRVASETNTTNSTPNATENPHPASENVQKPETIADGSPHMVLVDVVLVTTEELITTSKGINLLNALTLQIGSASEPAYSRASTNNPTGSVSTVITKAITIPALTYSLNIANANNSADEVLARPTLAAMEGQPSEFFAGTNLNAGVISTSAVGSPSVIPVDKRFGVKLAITPTFLPNGMVKLKIDALRTFLNANTNSTGFAYRLNISETSTNANVAMHLGDTLILSGLSEKESSNSRSGVPILGEVPGLQYLFSNKQTSDYQHSVLMLITPRAPMFTSKVNRNPTEHGSDNMKALREKFGFSERTPSNIELILNHLKTTNLFREFRRGDISLERWDRLHSVGDRLSQALEFLYY